MSDALRTFSSSLALDLGELVFHLCRSWSTSLLILGAH